MGNSLNFHYEVRFKLFAFDEENQFKQQSHVAKFDKFSDALKNRKLAFEAFSEYQDYLIQTDRVKLINSNYRIIQPSFISDELGKNSDEDFDDWLKRITRFREEIAIFIVVNDEVAIKELDFYSGMDFDSFEIWGDRNSPNLIYKAPHDFIIHKITSYEYEEQDIVDNLDLKEIPLYEYYKTDVSGLTQTVYHYGLDFAESGEDVESGAKRTILPTPQIWSSLEEYQEERKLAPDEQIETTDSLNIESIINNGENHTVEFKPSILYNFKTNKAGYLPKYIVAKVICSFMNSSGGLLFVGVKDDKSIQGLSHDYSLFTGNVQDKIRLLFDDIIVSYIGQSYRPLISDFIVQIGNLDILVIAVNESANPVFLKNTIRKDDNTYSVSKEFFIRMSSSSHQLKDIEEIIQYIFNKSWKGQTRIN